MLDKNLIQKKIRSIQEYLQEADPFLEMTIPEILSKTERLRLLERIFQLIVDAMVSINIRFIKDLNMASPDDLQSTFEILGQKDKILPYDFSIRISPVVGQRNWLIHRYEATDNKVFLENFKKNRQDFDDYLRYINEYLEKTS